MPRWFAPALVLALSLAPAAASAQTEPSTVAVALFQQGRDLMKQERYAEACPKLAESHRVEPKLGTLLNLAVCNEHLGKIATAWADYGAAEAMARREGGREHEREAFARAQLEALEKRISHLTLQASAPPAGLRITLDTQPLDSAVLGTPLPIDPGKHHISASAAGKKSWSVDVDVKPEKADFVVSIPALDAEAAPPPPPVVAPPAPIPPPAAPPQKPLALEPPPVVSPPPPPPSGTSTSTILMATGFSVGGLGVLIGAVTGAVTLSNASSIRQSCTNNMCGASQQGAINSANALANASNVSFAVGAAGLVVGVVGLIMRPSPQAQPARTGIRITPLVGPGSAGIQGSF